MYIGKYIHISLYTHDYTFMYRTIFYHILYTIIFDVHLHLLIMVDCILDCLIYLLIQCGFCLIGRLLPAGQSGSPRTNQLLLFSSRHILSPHLLICSVFAWENEHFASSPWVMVGTDGKCDQIWRLGPLIPVRQPDLWISVWTRVHTFLEWLYIRHWVGRD